jgi:predicted permease
MTFLRTIWRRLGALGKRPAVKREIDEELRFHVEQRTAENIAAGMTTEEAARAARKRFGNFQSVREECRERRRADFGEGFVHDIRFGFRMLQKNPGFAAVAVLTLALGIGSCTAMFSIVRAVLLRPLPFNNPGRLVWIENTLPGGLSSRTSAVGTFQEWCAQNQSFEKLGAYFAFFDYNRYTLTGDGEPRRLCGVGVSQNFLDVLGVQPMLGRGFTEDECRWNGPGTVEWRVKTVILSQSFWQQRFAGDRNIIGRSILLNGEPAEIVGVLPPFFDFASVFSPGKSIDLLLPFPLARETAAWGDTIFAIGRLKPGVTLRQAQADLDVINNRLLSTHRLDQGAGARATRLEDYIRGGFRTAFGILAGAVACVLLIACVNLSNLLLARANARRTEFAVRVALGASTWRLVRQAMTESLLLAFGGCVLGLPLAMAGTTALARLQTFNIPLLETATFDVTAFGFTVLITCLAGLLCGMLPAWQLSRGAAQRRLMDADQRGTAGKSGALIRQSLVVTEMSLACILLVSAGLLIRSFSQLLNVHLGFQPKNAMSWRVDPTRRFDSEAATARYLDQLVERVAAVPGVESVGLTDTLPLGRNREFPVGAKGEKYLPGQMPIAFPRVVDQNYLQTMCITLRGGRYFDASDINGTETAVIINETLARHVWPGQDAVGRILYVSWGVGDCRVAGVVGDVRHSSLEEKPGGEMYLNFHQTGGLGEGHAVELVVRASRLPRSLVPDVRAAIKAFDPTLPSGEFITLDQIVDDSVAPRRLITDLLGGFSALALTLAAIGLYGVISYSVGQRTREIGIRMSIGAQRRDVLRLIIGEGLKTAMLGVTAGIVAAVLLSRVLQSMLFGVTAVDPVTFATTVVTLLMVSLLACLIPACRASRIDPMSALRSE